MAFTDPQKVKVDGTTEVTLPRISTEGMSSVYSKDDGSVVLKLASAFGRRKRHTARIDLSKIIASTLNPSQNEEASASVYLVVDRPLQGYTNPELRKAAEGLKTFLSEANLEKLLSQES